MSGDYVERFLECSRRRNSRK